MALLVVVFLCGCAPVPTWERISAEGMEQGFKPLTLSTPPFLFSALLKLPPAGGRVTELVVYIEGDGRAVGIDGPTLDPTPKKALGWELARLDPAPAVLYLGRIGQYQPENTGKFYQFYWAEGRLAPDAVAATDQALNSGLAQVKALGGNAPGLSLQLIGYSGGGGMAALLAARRQDVRSLVTAAGLLDHAWWTESFGYRALSGSLNPADFAIALADLPQIHFYGQEDTVIPPAMSARFASLTAFKHLERMPVEADHQNGWVEAWPQLLKKIMTIRQSASLQ